MMWANTQCQTFSSKASGVLRAETYVACEKRRRALKEGREKDFGDDRREVVLKPKPRSLKREMDPGVARLLFDLKDAVSSTWRSRYCGLRSEVQNLR